MVSGLFMSESESGDGVIHHSPGSADTSQRLMRRKRVPRIERQAFTKTVSLGGIEMLLRNPDRRHFLPCGMPLLARVLDRHGDGILLHLYPKIENKFPTFFGSNRISIKRPFVNYKCRFVRSKSLGRSQKRSRYHRCQNFREPACI